MIFLQTIYFKDKFKKVFLFKPAGLVLSVPLRKHELSFKKLCFKTQMKPRPNLSSFVNGYHGNDMHV